MPRFLTLVLLATGCADGVCASCPTASLTANGETELVVKVGDLIEYAWSSSNADSASSSVEVRPSGDHCGNQSGTWVIDTLDGASGPYRLLECQAGFAYALSFIAVQLATGERAVSTIQITVN